MTALTTLSTTTVAPPNMVDGVIPVLDVGPFLAGAPGARGRLGGQLRFAFEHVGFYYLRGHGVPQSLIDATFATAARCARSCWRSMSRESRLAFTPRLTL